MRPCMSLEHMGLVRACLLVDEQLIAILNYCCVLFCFVGKERVFMSVAKMLNKKVYVEKPKWKMMVTTVDCDLFYVHVVDVTYITLRFNFFLTSPSTLSMFQCPHRSMSVLVLLLLGVGSSWQLCFDWSTEELSRLTASDPDSTNIWVVPMNHINFKSLGNKEA
jgi:hypothetical protein